MKLIVAEWKRGKIVGSLEVINGQLGSLKVIKGKGTVDGNGFNFTSRGPCRLEIGIDEERLSPAANPTFVTFQTKENPFTILLRDVSSNYPIWIPAYGVVVTEANDTRSYEEIEADIRRKGLQTALQRIANEPEENYETAAAATYELVHPIWLGVSRDIRIFELSAANISWSAGFGINPRLHGANLTLPETGDQAVTYYFTCGRGISCVRSISRRLEDGVLPILHTTLTDGDLRYNITSFVSLERTPLTAENLRGTHFLVADRYGLGYMFTPEQQTQFEALLPEEINRDEETVFYCRAQAINTGSVPRYAWFQAPAPYTERKYENGFGRFSEDRVFAVTRCNGAPIPKEEIAVLLEPGQIATLEFAVPHQPISAERAAALAKQNFDVRHAECRAYWQRKLDAAARMILPEKRIDEMARAGLLHLDLIAYGLEPDKPVVPCIGIYNAIGTESSPIIQFMDSMGWHDLAERCLEYFLEKQHDDGFMQNFGGYMLETGAALWSLGEHYRYIRNDTWLERVKQKLIKSCDYIIAWRERNLKEELRGHGYGLMEGKVADPEDPFRCYMLNGYAYLGLQRVAEMLAESDPAESKRIADAAEALRQDIRNSIVENMSQSPVVPIGDGSWVSPMGPWAEARGPVSLLTDENRWSTHGSILVRDSIIGPLYVAFCEVLEPNERAADWLLEYHADLMHVRNTAFTQPYYSPHPRVHLQRGEVNAFLKVYYNGFAGLADRNIYSFWEHYFHASPHKTHEEGWFLMQTRWMLYLEEEDMLRFLPGIPRAWMEHGKNIELTNVATYFGKASLKVESKLQYGTIHAVVECNTDRKPKAVEIRLPHPQGQKARQASGGHYNPTTETVRVDNFTGRAEVMLKFD